MDQPKTPMIDKAKALEDVNRELVRFVQWLSVAGHLAVALGPDRRPTAEDLVAQFLGIDLVQVAQERAALVDWANRKVSGRCERAGCGNMAEPGRTMCTDCWLEATGHR